MQEGMLAIWHDVAAGNEAVVSHWYNTEHHAERLEVEGFLEAHRYRLAGGEGRQFMSLYRTRDPGVLFSPAYRARLESPTPRTRQMMPTYRNMSRTVCRVERTAGRAEGGCVAALAGTAAPEAWPIDEVFARLLPQPGMLRCRWLLAEPAPAGTDTAESALRGGSDRGVAWAVLVDTNDVAEALAALAALEEALQPAAVAQCAAYRLVYAGRASTR
jgi:hypothetical protein